MAGLQTRKRGGKTAYQIQFFDDSGKRRTLYLGAKYDVETAEEIKLIVERVVDAITTDRAIDSSAPERFATLGAFGTGESKTKSSRKTRLQE